MIRRLSLLLVLLTLAAPASAQYAAPNRVEAVERVDRACPGLIRQDHAFTDAVASLLFAEDARWGRNGKRGNPNDPSHDALAFVNPASPFGVSVVDIIGGAGGPSPSVAWIDQTQATIDARTTGVWVRPSGVLPACLTGGTTPPVTPPQPPPVTPTPSVDLRPVLEQLAALRAGQETLAAAVAALAQRPLPEPDHPPDSTLLEAYVDDMVGAGPSGDGTVPNHLTDLKQRLDVIRAELEHLGAWLRGRRMLRY